MSWSSNISRRTLLRTGAGAASLLAAPAILTGRARGAQSITVGDTGGPYNKGFRLAFYDPFEKETGIRIDNVVLSPEPVPQWQMMVDTNNHLLDVSVITTEHVERLNRAGDYFEPLNLKGVDPADFIQGAITPKWVGAYMFVMALGYRTDTFGDKAPKSWADFWNTTDFPGRRSLFRRANGTLEAALLADGVKNDDLYPLDLDRAFASLGKIRSDIAVWWESGAQSTQIIQNGEVDLINIWNPRAQTAIDDHAPVGIAWVDSRYSMGGWSIPRGGPKADLSRQFVEYTLDPERQAKYTEVLAVSPTHLRGYDFVAENKRATLPTAPDRLDRLRPADTSYWAEHLDAVTERFEAWLLS